MTETIKFLKVREVKTPSRANPYDAGIDFYVPEFEPSFIEELKAKNPEIEIAFDGIYLEPHKRVLIPSGIHCQMAAPGRALIAANKSGVATKNGLIFGAQVVDYEYQGEIHLSILNVSDTVVVITPGMKILQFLETPVFNSMINITVNKPVSEFYSEVTNRGADGFGSTDNK
jgi:dUTPase